MERRCLGVFKPKITARAREAVGGDVVGRPHRRNNRHNPNIESPPRHLSIQRRDRGPYEKVALGWDVGFGWRGVFGRKRASSSLRFLWKLYGLFGWWRGGSDPSNLSHLSVSGPKSFGRVGCTYLFIGRTHLCNECSFLFSGRSLPSGIWIGHGLASGSRCTVIGSSSGCSACGRTDSSRRCATLSFWAPISSRLCACCTCRVTVHPPLVTVEMWMDSMRIKMDRSSYGKRAL